MTVSEQLLALYLASLKGDELPIIDSLPNTGRIIVFNTDTKLVSTILKEKLTLAGAGGSSNNIDVIIDYNEQVDYNIPSKPENIDLVIGRVKQYRNVDYTYSNLTGDLTITNASVGASIKTTTLFDVRGFQNSLSKEEQLIINSPNQAGFIILEKPNNISLSINRTILSEGTDYTYNNTTGALTIINQSYIDQITINSILIARKYY